MSEIAISLKNVAKYYKLYGEPKDRLKEALHPFKKKYHKPFYVLKGLNLEIGKGDVLGVVGRNGCGKSTLLKLIAGVLQPSEGTLTVNGKVTALLELGAGFNPEFTGIDNIQFYAKVLGISDQEFEEKLPLIIAFADLGDFLYQPVKTYSSGMKSRLGFSVAVYVDPEILILDEVLAVGDALFKRKCYAKMEEFFKAGKTIIYVSHDANSVNQLCNRAVLIHEGEIIMDGEPKKVTQYYEKILFSKSDDIKSILAELPILVSEEKAVVEVSYKEKVIDEQYNKTEPNDSAYFIEYLRPKDFVKIQNYDVDIHSPKVITPEGTEVNALVLGENYIYTFRVIFKEAFRGVSFGSQVKSIRGQIISLASLQEAGDTIDQIMPGEYLVKWSFSCMLLPGDYFFDSSTTGYVLDDEREVLCRIKDLYMIRVIKPKNLPYQGLVSLNQKIKVERVPAMVRNV